MTIRQVLDSARELLGPELYKKLTWELVDLYNSKEDITWLETMLKVGDDTVVALTSKLGHNSEDIYDTYVIEMGGDYNADAEGKNIRDAIESAEENIAEYEDSQRFDRGEEDDCGPF